MKTFKELTEDLTEAKKPMVPSALKKWADKEDFTVMATRTYPLDTTSLWFMGKDSKGNDRQGILLNTGKVTMFKGSVNQKDWINAMI